MMSTCDSVDDGVLRRRQLLFEELEVDGHGVERILHFVSDTGRESAKCGHATRELEQLCSLGAMRESLPQLVTHARKDIAEVLELVFLEIEGCAEVTSS